MASKVDRTNGIILRALNEAGGPCGASRIACAVSSMGVDVISERTVRHYLLRLDRQGLTRLVSRRRGRVLTRAGRAQARDMESVPGPGAASARIDTLAYRMSYDLARKKGTVILNVSILDESSLRTVLDEADLVLNRGFAVAEKIVTAQPGAVIGSTLVAEGMIGIGTVCSITLNGILQKHGIPVVSLFAGLLEISRRQCVRFINMIEYKGSTLDPVDVFVRAGMTGVRDVVLRGSGVIPASFRTIPAAAASEVSSIERRTRAAGLGGITAVGRPGQPLFGIPVEQGYCGIVVAAGITPVVCSMEAGMRVTVQSLAGLEEYSRFITTQQARRQYL
ncbi:MAG: NrpR regulatory domain-containing protein [Kiritimatiellia bacterium]